MILSLDMRRFVIVLNNLGIMDFQQINYPIV